MVFPWIPLLRPVLDASILGFPLAEVIKWAFTTPVQFWVGARFHIGAIKALRNGRQVSLSEQATLFVKRRMSETASGCL